MPKKQRKLAINPTATRIYLDNYQYIENRHNSTGEKKSDLLRDIVDDGIRAQKIRDNGYDETAEHFKNYVGVATNNSLRPLRKQLDEILKSMAAMKQQIKEDTVYLIDKTDNLGEHGKRTTDTLGTMSDIMTELQLASNINNRNTSGDLLDDSNNELVLTEIRKLRELNEVMLGNLVGMRVAFWLYLYEIMLPLVSNYSSIDQDAFGYALKEHVTKLFTVDVLKEIAYMKAGDLEEFIVNLVSEFHSELAKAAAPKELLQRPGSGVAAD